MSAGATVTQARDDLALAMLAAWLNVRPDQIPAENRAHTCAYTMAAWQRVGEAARLATEAEFAAREAALVETIVRDLALTKLANFEHASAEWLDGFGFAMERVIARAHTTSEGEG